MAEAPRIAVVLPCYRVARQIGDVLAQIPPEVQRIVVVDDACPERSGEVALAACSDPRLTVLRLAENQGVGGAVMAGMAHAADDGAEIVVKVDGDGQHDPVFIPRIVAPLLRGEADYSKGNRFFQLEYLEAMPRGRLLGNAVLSFMTKLSTGYWTMMDPTNGFVAIHASVLAQLPPEKIGRRYMFESDMLFRLGTLRARVAQIPMLAIYASEQSGLKPLSMVLPMLRWHIVRTVKRLFYGYFLRSFSLASLFFVIGLSLSLAALVLGAGYWSYYARIGENAPSGTVMLVGLLAIFGVNFLLSFFSHDMGSEPREPIHPYLPRPDRLGERVRRCEVRVLTRAGQAERGVETVA